MYLEQDLKTICKDLGLRCDEVIIIAKPQGRKPKVVTYGSLPECLQLVKHAAQSLDLTIRDT